MIRFSLYCGQGHEFEGWFASNKDYEKQKKTGLLSCPSCGSSHVEKALMAPYVATKSAERGAADNQMADSKNQDKTASPADNKQQNAKQQPAELEKLNGREAALQKLLLLQRMQRQKLDTLHKLRDIARKMRENAENVGDDFAEEARKMHYGESKKRAIYGEANKEEVDSLREDGVDVTPMPRLPEDEN